MSLGPDLSCYMISCSSIGDLEGDASAYAMLGRGVLTVDEVRLANEFQL